MHLWPFTNYNWLQLVVGGIIHSINGVVSTDKGHNCMMDVADTWSISTSDLIPSGSTNNKPKHLLVGGILAPLKNMSSSVGIMTFPIYYMESH